MEKETFKTFFENFLKAKILSDSIGNQEMIDAISELDKDIEVFNKKEENQEEYEYSLCGKKNLMKALFEFQQDLPVLLKETQGYGYTYISFEDIVFGIKKSLGKSGLSFSQPIKENNILETIIFHFESGEYFVMRIKMEGSVAGANMNEVQKKGSLITYYKRYSLCAMLGIVADTDTDAVIEPRKTKNQETNNMSKYQIFMADCFEKKLTIDKVKELLESKNKELLVFFTEESMKKYEEKMNQSKK